MPLALVGMPNMTTTSGGTTSSLIRQFDDAWALTIYSPVVTSTSVTIEVEPTSTGASFVTLQSGGTDVVIAGEKATVLSPVPFLQMRMVSSGVEGAERIFRVTKTILT